MEHFAIAGLQVEVFRRDNREQISAQIARVKRDFPWVRMIVLGELASFGSSRDTARPGTGEAESFYAGLAREHELWLVPGSVYEREAEHVYNTALVINPAGETVGRYRKQFPFLPYESGVSPGSRALVFDVPGVCRMGVSICYDQWFPETTRQLAWLGAEVVLCPTMTNTIDRELELCLARSNAITNQCYFFNINVAGELGNGRSIVVDPQGAVVHQAGDGAEIIPVDVDLGQVRRARSRGVLGLGQVLKSFRDSEVEFPAYDLERRRSTALDELGDLVLPDKGEQQWE